MKIAPKALVLAMVLGVLSGLASAAFLWTLGQTTSFFALHHSWIMGLPVAGFLFTWATQKWAPILDRGHNLLLDEIHEPQRTIPLVLIPLVWIGTLVTHVFGGSAGREGTAVQIGGALADQVAKWSKASTHTRKLLLIMGLSAGFSGVFGTPIAGTFFGLEVLTVGLMQYEALLYALVAALCAHITALACSVSHEHFVAQSPTFGLLAIACACIAGLFFGQVARAFMAVSHGVQRLTKQIPFAPLRPFVGGVLFVGIVLMVGHRHTGLSLPLLKEAFSTHLLPFWDGPLKLLGTSLVVGSGFKGGEVTPLFVIGATTGNTLAHFLPFAPSFFAALGFAAVFAGCTNTPITCTFLAIECFGPEIALWALIACVISFLTSGSGSLYLAQRKAP